MSNRLDDVLAAIDAETAKCICGNTIPENGASLDYCSPPCQYGYLASRVGDTPDPEVASSRTTTTDGRAINEEVNRRFQPGADTEDAYGGLMAMVADRLSRTSRSFSFPDTRHAATFQRTTADSPETTDSHTTSNLAETIRSTMGIPDVWANPRLEPTRDEPEWIPTEAAHERAAAALANETETSQPIGLRYTIGGVTYTGTGHATRLPDGSFRLSGSFDSIWTDEQHPEEQPQVVEDEANGTTRIMWVPDIADSNAPTARELASGVTLGVLDENGRLQTVTPALLTPEILSRSLRETRDAYYLGYWEAPSAEPEPTLTGDELRALEHQQQRGTGPTERRQRLPRDHGPRSDR